MTAFRSACYGLGIEADVPVPGLAPMEEVARIDVRLHVGCLPDDLEARRPYARRWRAGASVTTNRVPVLVISTLPDNGDYLFQYTDGTEFLVSADGSSIWTAWQTSSSLDDMTTYLLGPVLGFVLRLRGTTCLHASVVVLPDGAVGFVGPAGAGKSTLAAAFARLGRTVVTDDVAALVEDGDGFLVHPGYPRLRLRPHAVTTLYGHPDALPALTPTWDKRFLDLHDGHPARQSRPHRLAAFYVLAARTSRDSEPVFAPVPARDRLMALIANGYVTNLMDEQARAREFALLGRMAARLPLRQASLPDGPDTLDRVCLAIEEDTRQLAATHAPAQATGEPPPSGR